jgi:hypothetical protein
VQGLHGPGLDDERRSSTGWRQWLSKRSGEGDLEILVCVKQAFDFPRYIEQVISGIVFHDFAEIPQDCCVQGRRGLCTD